MHLLSITSLMLVAFTARIIHKTWLHPGPFALLYWTIICLTTTFFAKDYKLHTISLLWLLLSLLSLYTGTIFGNLRTANQFTTKKRIFFSILGTNRLKKYHTAILLNVVFFSFCGLLSIFVLAAWAKGSITVLFSLNDVLSLGHTLAKMRYSGQEYNQPLSYSVLSYGIFSAALFGGMLYRIAKNKISALISFLPFAVAFLNAIVKTQRGTIILTMFIWCSSYFATRAVVDQGKIVFFSLRNFSRLLILLTVFCISYISLQMIREGELNVQFIGPAFLTFKSAALGSLPAFSYWVNETFFDKFEFTFGEFSFNRIAYYLFHVPSRSPGMFGDVIWLGDTYREGTTIFTVFRALMQDFTSTGSLIVLFVIGMSGGYSFKCVKKGNIDFIPLLAMYYSYVMIGYLASMFSWNGIIASFFVFFLFFFGQKISITQPRPIPNHCYPVKKIDTA